MNLKILMPRYPCIMLTGIEKAVKFNQRNTGDVFHNCPSEFNCIEKYCGVLKQKINRL